MKHVITKFYEYKGKDAVIGYRYSDPTEKYKIVIPFNYNEDELELDIIIDKTNEILKEDDVFEYKTTYKEDGIGNIILKIFVICYTDNEAKNIAENLIRKLAHEFDIDINFSAEYAIF